MLKHSSAPLPSPRPRSPPLPAMMMSGKRPRSEEIERGKSMEAILENGLMEMMEVRVTEREMMEVGVDTDEDGSRK